jgi:hypothetical protein
MAKKDLIIGAFKNYTFETVRPWIDSINETGFDGEKIIISIGSSNRTNQQLADSGFGVLAADVGESKMMFHMERFLHIYGFLKENGHNYRNVITTDVRDVIFQHNPFPFVEKQMELNPEIQLVGISEGIKIKNENWNKDNILKNFGYFFYDTIEDCDVLNVGTIAGKSEAVKDLCGMLFQLSMNRPDWVADQAAYNLLMNWVPYKNTAYISTLDDAWACNLHVTNKPEQLEEFGPHLLHERPIFEDGMVKDGKNKQPFAIVHQYDRVPEMLEFYKEKYQKSEIITIKT